MEIITREEAKGRGLKKYYTGKPCKRGHVGERYVTGACVTCKKEKYEDNKEYLREYGREHNKKYSVDNKEHRNEYLRNRYATDENFRMSELCREMLRRTLKATSSTKTSRTYDLLGYCNEELKESIESKFLAGMSWEDDYDLWHIDHKYPVSRYIRDGVTDPAIINALDNLIPMWAEHNKEKDDMTLEEYLEVRNDLMDVYGRFL